MSTPTKKQLMVRSLKALHKERVDILFRLKAMQRQRRQIEIQSARDERKLAAVEAKLTWEINTNGKTLSDQT